jgi:hypothetical protein
MNDLIAGVISNARRTGPAAEPAGPAPPAAQIVRGGPGSRVRRVSQTLMRRANEVDIRQIIEGNEVRDAEQEIILNLADRPFYFDIRLLETKGDAEWAQPHRLGSSARPLQPGRTYRVRVSPSLNLWPSEDEWPLRQERVIVGKALRLFLVAMAESAPRGGMPEAPGGQDVLFPLASSSAWCHDFSLVIPPENGQDTLSLELRYKEEGSENLDRPASSVVVSLVRSVEDAAAPEPEIYYIAAGTRPPERTALLHVLPEGQERLRFWAWVRDRVDRPWTAEPIPRPTLSRADYPDEAAYLEAVRDAAHDLAIANPANIVAWLEGVLDLYGEGGSLVVVDLADTQIPWEMFRLGGGRYLGARALVVRFVEAQYRGRRVALNFEETSLTGRLSAYTRRQDLASTRASCPVLAALAIDPFDSPEDLESDLIPGEDVAPVGLVYLCGGSLLVYGDEGDLLADLHAVYGDPVRIRFQEVEGLLDPRPLFFVNAPYSARVLRRGAACCGLAQAALVQVASGYIGTIGPVPESFACHVAQRFLEAAAQPGGVRPAEFLRALRADAAKAIVQRLSLPERESARRQFLAASMYVYYGNPLARVRLTGSPATAPSPRLADA